MKYVHRMCYEQVTEECSKLGHKNIGMDYEQTMSCVRGTFEGSNTSKDDNRVLKDNSDTWRKYGTAYWPSIVINDRTYRGDLVPDSVLNAICAAFSTKPSFCVQFEEQLAGVGSEPSGITGNTLIFVVVLLVVVNIAMILLYKRCTNKELKEDMQLQVNSAVS